MALYNKSGNMLSRGQQQYESSMRTMGQRTREGSTTEYEGAGFNPLSAMSQGIGMLGQGKQMYGMMRDGGSWVLDHLKAPNVQEQAAAAESGAQAAHGAEGALEGIQMNTGAPVTSETLESFFYGEPGQAAGDAASQVAPAAGETGATVAAESAPAGLSTMGAVLGPSVGGVAGGLAGRELGKAIGGKTGGDIGSVAGSLGGAYLGGLAGSALAGGAAAGAAAGSFVPGVGTAIGAGIGALTSFFL